MNLDLNITYCMAKMRLRVPLEVAEKNPKIQRVRDLMQQSASEEGCRSTTCTVDIQYYIFTGKKIYLGC